MPINITVKTVTTTYIFPVDRIKSEFCVCANTFSENKNNVRSTKNNEYFIIKKDKQFKGKLKCAICQFIFNNIYSYE